MNVVIERAKSKSDNVPRCDHEYTLLQEPIPIVLLHIATVEQLLLLVKGLSDEERLVVKT